MGFEINDSTSLYSAHTQKKVKSGENLGVNSNNFDFRAAIRDLNSFDNQISSKGKAQLAKLLKTGEQRKVEIIKQRNQMKAANGLTWKQTQDKIKSYREKYLPKRDQNNPAYFADSPYKDYVYAKQEGGIVKFYVDERKYIQDRMSPQERKDFEKTMAAYDELYPQTREISDARV